MIPRFKADFGTAELRAVFSHGKGDIEVPQFEQAFAELFEQKHAVAMPYGRTGLIILLKALGLLDAEVLCPAYTCLVVPEAIEKSGNNTVFVDCDEDDYNVSFDHLEKAVGPQTRAFIATSIFGHPLNGTRLAQFRARHPQIKIIQDCAHSFSAQWQGKSVVPMGDAALFGLNISKTMSSVFGGMVTTDDDTLAKRLRELSAQMLSPAGSVKILKRKFYMIGAMLAFTSPAYRLVNALEQKRFLDKLTVYHTENEVFMPADYLETMASFEACVGRIQCGKYANIIAHRQIIAQVYFEELADVVSEDFVLPPNDLGATYSHFAVRTHHAADLVEYARVCGTQLGTLIDYHCPDNGAFRGNRYVGTRKAAAWPGQMINLPVQRNISPTQARSLARQISVRLKALRATV